MEPTNPSEARPMAKTHATSEIQVAGQTFRTNATPDTFDLRDLDYRPMLRVLPPQLQATPSGTAFLVLRQQGESCTGHAVAAMIDTVLSRQAVELGFSQPPPVSPYMLYRLARRYDEFGGEADTGSSLRGAFKGWLRHGIATTTEWNARSKALHSSPLNAQVDLDEPDFVASCRLRPLGAYYRVNPFRLDDMQSAVNELHAIAVSAAVHSGWSQPRWLKPPNGAPFAIIERDRAATPAGGHAFAIVGYDEHGFLVQNSWGTDWGDRGFAILTYDDWLRSAYDAWVARPGVPNTPSASPSSTSRVTTSGDVVISGGPNLTLLRNYVVDTGNDGVLSDSGRFTSNPAQLDGIVANMTAKHDAWTAGIPGAHRDIVLWAHGGLIDETAGLGIAERHLGWWLNSHVYPINFVWESGAIETIVDALGDVTRGRLPFGGLRFGSDEQWDRFVEQTARRLFSGLWGQMKGNAFGASAPTSISRPRGGTEIANRLLAYRDRYPAGTVRIHLAGHSAGAIFLATLADRIVQTGLRIESLALLAGAVTNADFVRFVVPHLTIAHDRDGSPIESEPGIKRLTVFDLLEQMEQDDQCPGGDVAVYHKSLLYLVARALEPSPNPVTGMVPLVGLQLGLAATPPGWSQSLGEALLADGAKIVIAPGGTPPDPRSDARGHGDFDDDRATMTSVLLRMLDVTDPPAGSYVPNDAIRDLPAAPPSGAQLPVPTPEPAPVGARAATTRRRAGGALAAGGRRPARRPAAHAAPRPGWTEGTAVHVPVEASVDPAVASPTFDVLYGNGYTAVEGPSLRRRARTDGR
jgi:Papain family cysteine protease